MEQSAARESGIYCRSKCKKNDIIILFAFGTIVKFLLGVSNVEVPFNTIEAALATTVGVLTEVPVILMLVRIANDYVNAHYGVTLQYEQMQCGFTDFNEQCIKERCPFHE